MRLADTRRAGKAEHGDRLVQPPRRDTPPQLLGDRLDGVLLADHAGADARGQIVGVDRDQALASLLISLLQTGLVGKPIQNIHDEPRQV